MINSFKYLASYSALLLAAAGGVAAQSFPTKPLRLVTSEVGGSADTGARLVAKGMTERFGQQVIVDNRGSGVIPGTTVARAQPDGYTLLFFGGTFWLQPLWGTDVPYDPVRDFAPVTMAVQSPTILVAHPAVQANNVLELVKLAKSKPGELNFATGAPGSTNYLGAELFKHMAQLDIVGIGYKGTGPAVNGIVSGQVQLMFATASAVIPLVKQGRLRALAVGSSRRTAIAPGVPTVAESGVPGYESVSRTAMFAPARTPPEVIARLNREANAYLATNEAKERFLATGAEAIGTTPDELRQIVVSELDRVGKMVKAVGMHVRQ
jgi:tripartite-type tricarboxylate transporter receptor subunit TctC